MGVDSHVACGEGIAEICGEGIDVGCGRGLCSQRQPAEVTAVASNKHWKN